MPIECEKACLEAFETTVAIKKGHSDGLWGLVKIAVDDDTVRGGKQNMK
jgi:hypothetical protein